MYVIFYVVQCFAIDIFSSKMKSIVSVNDLRDQMTCVPYQSHGLIISFKNSTVYKNMLKLIYVHNNAKNDLL